MDLQEEQEVDGAEEEEENENINEREYDEHIWTSPANAIKMINYIKDNLNKIDSENSDIYNENAKSYIAEIEELQSDIQDIVSNSKRKHLVFGDKMPMQYFIQEFDLEVSAAFNGCAEETVPTSKTIAYLVNLIEEEKIPVVLYIELSEGKVAKTLAEETGAKAMQIQTLHNISKDDFDNGETYVSLMRRNLDVLREALN